MDHMYDVEYPERDVSSESLENESNTDKMDSDRKRWQVYSETNDPPVLLDPDHPLMKKFQATYKECLVRESDRVNAEIIELKSSLKKRKHEYEYQMSNEMYILEQEVTQQRKTIQEYEEALDSVIKLRSEKEDYVKKCRETYRDQLEKLNVEKKKDVELLSELEALSLLCKQYEAWQKETDSELTVNQRISEKLSIEKKNLAQEKKKSDLMIYKLTTEVWNLEAQIELLNEQIRIKSDELEAIKNKSADNATDLEALCMEQKRLVQLWNSVILNIQKRDKSYTELNADMEKMQTEIKTLCTSIELCEKEIGAEMQKNEKLTMMKDKLFYELAGCTKSVENEETKKSNTEAAVMELTTIIEMTEKQLSQANNENRQKSDTMKSYEMQFVKLIEEKTRLENETLDKLQSRLIYNTTAGAIASKIRQLKEYSRKEEINVLKSENQLAKVLLKIERQKNSNHQRASELEEEKKRTSEKQNEIDIMESNVRESILNLSRKQNNLEPINKRIGMLIDKMEGKEISPIEYKIMEYEEQINDYTKRSKKMQQNWLRMQECLVQYTKQFQKLESENNLTKEQIEVLEHKLMKLENVVNNQRQEANTMQRTIDVLQTKIDQLSKQMFEDKEHNEELERKFHNLTLEYTAKLKDAEIAALTLEEDIASLEDEKVQLAIDIRKLKREVISWQKMGIMAVETKQKVDEERSTTGVVGRMKTEIHRMQVREQQLSSTAAKLANDLAQSVWRRAAAANRARACPQSLASRHTFVAKIKEKRSDIRRISQEIEVNKNMIEAMINEKEQLLKEMSESKENFFELQNDINNLQKQIEDGQLLKQKNLERIIRLQRYGQHCSAILSGQTRLCNVKSEPNINNEHEKQKNINSQLITFVHKLLQDMPEHYLQLMRIINTLNVYDDE